MGERNENNEEKRENNQRLGLSPQTWQDTVKKTKQNKIGILTNAKPLHLVQPPRSGPTQKLIFVSKHFTRE